MKNLEYWDGCKIEGKFKFNTRIPIFNFPFPDQNSNPKFQFKI